MRVYLINLERRPDRLAAMQAQAAALNLALTRVAALDAQDHDAATAARTWFSSEGAKAGGPLGEIPRGDQCCLLSHRRAWELFFASNEDHAVFLEDDVRLTAGAAVLNSDAWIPADIAVMKLEHYGPPGQRVLVTDLRAVQKDVRLGRMLSRHTGAAAYILSRSAACLLLDQAHYNLPVDHLLFNPNNSPLFAALSPWQLLPTIARQEQFLDVRKNANSDIEATRRHLRALSPRYVARELVRLGYDLKLLPRQALALLTGAKFVAVKTAG